MRRLLLTSAAVLLAVCTAHLARADVIADNFDTGDAFNTTSGSTVSLFFSVGVRVVPAANATATDVFVAMKSTGTANITLTICVDASGHPGAAVAATSLTSVLVNTADPQVYHGVFATPQPLTAGTTYWIKAVPGVGGGSATWMLNTTGQTGYASTTATGSWVSNGGVGPAFRLEDNSAPPLSGACCAGSICAISSITACNVNNARFAGIGTSCNAVGNTTTPCCKADFNQSGSVSVQDIFDYLAAWFAGNAQADINGGGLGVQDIFDFLSAWFAGC